MNAITVKNAGKSFRVFIRDEADESVAAEIFKHHEYRTAEAAIVNAHYPIIDAGAHAGFFCLYVRSLNPSVKIIAIEPDENNRAHLQRHISENKLENIEVVDGVVAGASGSRVLYTATDSHNHSLINETETEVTVPAFSLSDLFKKCILQRVSLLKLDIEGGEYEVLEQADREMFTKIDAIALEYHSVPCKNFKDIEQLLRENGYGVRHFPSKFDKTMGFLFAQRKSS